MMASTFFSFLAVLTVSLEMPRTTAVLGALAVCLVWHGA
jgi:hypothetical protein